MSLSLCLYRSSYNRVLVHSWDSRVLLAQTQERPYPKWSLARQIKSMRNQRQWIRSGQGWTSRQNRLPALSLIVTVFTTMFTFLLFSSKISLHIHPFMLYSSCIYFGTKRKYEQIWFLWLTPFSVSKINKFKWSSDYSHLV